MKIIERLKHLSEICTDEVKIDLKLYNLADTLEKRARAHLKRIITILQEFDIHDEKHSEKVIENIEALLGDETIQKLSSYELFLLHLSAFFHDCAMAPSDWEINTMKLTEGYGDFAEDKNSVRHDLQTPFKLSAAKDFIKERKVSVYDAFTGDVKDWMFSPAKEDDLITYLATLLIDYQNFRNGFSENIKRIASQDEFADYNEFLRIDYIRSTHHSRIEVYVKNLENTFGNAFEQPAWGKRLAHDLAIICRSHGEPASFIEDFSTNSQYYGAQSANLQMAAVMLRLGDIIHFSYDRAPIDLRSPRLFKSEYSFQQWAIKNSGANYTIENGLISFRAYCEVPETDFKLHQYIDWIELEIQNYFKFQRKWKSTYVGNLKEKVDRDNITNDTEIFLPKRGLSFTLNQSKIIDLLMGVGLYKDRFACLRELYQNSLDACRCMLAQNNSSNRAAAGDITFGIEYEGDNTFLYCLDNGIGMTKEVVESFLLKIGNSYYKSADFFRKQAQWDGNFTPTSQFGIGILSCFMIGDKLEITTKASDDEYISCSIDGPHESFYYKKTSALEKERIPVTGTLVKILLNDECSKLIENYEIDKLGLALLYSEHQSDLGENQHYQASYPGWGTHLYNIIDQFISILPSDINVNVSLFNHSKQVIYSKPIFIDPNVRELDITGDDLEFANEIDRFKFNYSIGSKKLKLQEVVNTIMQYKICIGLYGVEYTTIIFLPKENYTGTSSFLANIPVRGRGGLNIDGIVISESFNSIYGQFYSSELTGHGILDFTKDLRPQISVDRTEIVNYPEKCEMVAEEMAILLLKEIIDTAKAHIDNYKLNVDSHSYKIMWESIFSQFFFLQNLFITELSQTKYGDIFWERLCAKVDQKWTILEFMKAEKLHFGCDNILKNNSFTIKMLLTKIISANDISMIGNVVTILCDGKLNTELVDTEDGYNNYILVKCDTWEMEDSYDFIPSLYPFVSNKLFSKFKHGFYSYNDRYNVLHTEGSELLKLIKQSPLSIHATLGLYNARFNNSNSIYKFDQQQSYIRNKELNDVEKNEIYFLTVYISPTGLNSYQESELQKIEDIDPRYFKGVTEGWSLLFTSKDIQNVVIIPGKCTRVDLVSKLTDAFWEEYKDITFKFIDDTIVTKDWCSQQNIST